MKTQQDDRQRRIISQQAAQWVCELRRAEPAQQVEFAQWLKRSPQHVTEFLLATTMWQDARDASSDDDTDLEALMATALAAEGSGNVLWLTTDKALVADEAAVPKRGWSKAAAWGLAASLLLALAAGIGTWHVHAGPTYATEIGEQRTLRLADGSLLQLNTHSRVQIRFSEKFRDVHLLEGEAFFCVEHDASRPFRVTAGDALVQAVGTQFNVYRDGAQTKVAVIEGRVKVLERDAGQNGGSPPQLLAAGEQMNIALGAPASLQKAADVVATVAWRQRKLVFSGQRLEEIAAEFNRYNERRIVVRDEARNKLLSGTFNADDPDSLLLFLNKLNDLTVSRAGEDFVIADR